MDVKDIPLWNTVAADRLSYLKYMLCIIDLSSDDFPHSITLVSKPGTTWTIIIVIMGIASVAMVTACLTLIVKRMKGMKKLIYLIKNINTSQFSYCKECVFKFNFYHFETFIK